MPRPIGIDLFAGVGGMSLGFEQAGFDVRAAVEIDPVHAAAHAFNFPECTTIARSISLLSGREIRRLAGLGKQSVDVVFGGAPCQGFSLIGQRALDDPRNRLVREFARTVEELKPKYFVFENVKGITVGRHRAFLDELIRHFTDIGYNILPWKVLNASSYGTPQHRERLILIGARMGVRVPQYPNPTTRALSESNGAPNFAPTCEEALGDLPDVAQFPELLSSDSVRIKRWPKNVSEYASTLRVLHKRDWFFGYPRKWDPTVLTSSLRTEHSAISERRFRQTPAGEVEPISRFLKLSADGLCNTLRAGTDAARGAFTSPRPIHYRFPRCITVREMARLHGFPDWFRFHVTKWHGARQIGNAVPPPMARAVAGSIIKALGVTPSRPSKVVSLGAVSLLTMDMAEAAKFWGVEKPIGKRDKKSGARKRSQMEIERQLQFASL